MLKQLAIEITNACNCSCVFCPHRLSTRPVVHMDLPLYEKLIKEVKQYDIPTDVLAIGVCGIGEPLCHPQFKEILEIARKHDVPVGVGSNAGLLHRHISTLIEYAPDQMVFSIDAVTAETHAKMRPGVNFPRMMHALEEYITLLRGAKKKPRQFWLQILVSEWNKHEVQPFIDMWRPKIDGIPGAKLFVKCICPWPYHEANSLYPSPDPGFLPGDPLVDVADFSKPPEFREKCTLFNGFAQIMSDGTYVPCCLPMHDPWGIGNARDFTIRDLFNSAKMRELRKMDKKDVEFCKDCI